MGGGLARCVDGSEQAHLHPMWLYRMLSPRGLGVGSLVAILKGIGLRLAVRPVGLAEFVCGGG